MMEDITKNIIFTTNAIGANGQPTTIQYQTADGTILKQPKIEGQKADQPTFYYTTTNGSAATTVNLAQLTTDDNKTCYIAQPVGGYNYALVNGMQLNQGGTIGIATLDAQGRLQIVNQNKPIAASLQTISPMPNTISNISFKCDVCGLMFSHLALLNHHKRIHTQDGSDQQQQQGQPETIVLNAQGLVQAQNIITENGQMGQIQIVATESLDPAANVLQQQQQQQQHTNSVVSNIPAQNTGNESTANTTNITGLKSVKLTQSKCITCGNQMLQPAKRKGPKLVRCEDCIRADQEMSTQQGITPTQIFVAQDGEIKCEINEFVGGGSTDSSPMDTLTAQDGMLSHQLQPMQVVSNSSEHQQNTQQIQNIAPKQEQNQTSTNNHPVKKRNQQQVTKCQKCNGSGVVFVGTGSPATKQQAANGKTENPKPFTCNICGGTFSRYSSLWSHKKLHSGEKNYKCSICGLAFAKAVYLKNHARIHTGEKPYKCQTCGMQFSQSPHLKNHERTHSGERPYVCEVCDKGFARHATLWNHRRIHTGEKPYKCEICGSAFSQAAHLKNHAKVHSGEKPFRCDICSAAFADRFALKRHRGIHQKYGQTAPRQPAQTNQQSMSTDGQSVMIHKQEIAEMDDDAQHEVIISGL
ncbi:zinc finger protein 492 [Ceratitis capitata]|uniref:zinc finger protein 492 n=1 Tax=Ceratitis capitata TaxID=7213 RepID=UPI00032A03D8|nr:zinc finger protein 492 [Ceratitis capitata]XP_004534439.1 zinc finger protein 492 [Ceratitis capitata]XP_020716558.1 zinc finger protein 492 [Ceratitis capitata]